MSIIHRQRNGGVKIVTELRLYILQVHTNSITVALLSVTRRTGGVVSVIVTNKYYDLTSTM